MSKFVNLSCASSLTLAMSAIAFGQCSVSWRNRRRRDESQQRSGAWCCD